MKLVFVWFFSPIADRSRPNFSRKGNEWKARRKKFDLK